MSSQPEKLSCKANTSLKKKKNCDAVIFSLGCFLTVFRNITQVTILRTGSQVQENLPDQSGSELDHWPRRIHAVALDVSPLRNEGLFLHFITQQLMNYIRATVRIAF